MTENASATKVCTKCGNAFPATTEYFYRAYKTKSVLLSSCKSCDNKRRTTLKMKRYKANPEYAKWWNAKGSEYNRRVRKAALQAYSGENPRCACCGEQRLEFLAIDHIDGGGGAHRARIRAEGKHSIFTWLKANNYPPGFRVLCHNCNQSLGHYGYCPHHVERGLEQTLGVDRFGVTSYTV